MIVPGPHENDVKKIVKELKLAKGGVGDGFAHDEAYITRTNAEGYEGMAAEHIAGFLGHFSGGPALRNLNIFINTPAPPM